MNLMVIGANIFLETMLDQNKADEYEAFQKKIITGKMSCVVSRSSIHAIEAIVGMSEMIGTFLRDVNASVGLHVYDTDT